MAKPLILQTVDNYNGANDILTKLKTVDGTGSGLDADTIDSCNINDSGTTTSDLWTANKITAQLALKEPSITKNTGFNLALETSTTNIKMNGAVSVGSLSTIARADHIHPSDTTKANVASPTFTGVVTSPTFSSSVATGTAPLTVASTTAVTNLNADLLDGYHAGNASGQIPISNSTNCTNLNADYVDGRHAADLMFSGSIGTSDFNTVTQSGAYRFESGNANAPSSFGYGQLLVMHGASDTITQIASDYSSGVIYWRSGNPSNVGGTGSWGPWRRLTQDSDFTSTTSGYQKLPSGIILQWGSNYCAIATYQTTTYPIAFPNGVLCVNATAQSWSSSCTVNGLTSKTNFGLYIGGTAGQNAYAYWFAVGY